jgi:flagellar basal body-associated protein FliL
VILAESTTLVAVVFAVAGVLLVLGVAAVFYAIGRGEDRQREEEERATPRPRKQPQRPPRRRFRRRP